MYGLAGLAGVQWTPQRQEAFPELPTAVAPTRGPVSAFPGRCCLGFGDYITEMKGRNARK